MQGNSVGGGSPLRSDETVGATRGDRACSYPSTEHPEKTAPAARYAVRWGCIPGELRERAQWLVATPDASGACKVPMSVNPCGDLVAGSSTNRQTWLSFNHAAAVAYERRLGIGYVLSADDPFACIDLDVKNQQNAPGTPDKWTTQEQLDRFLAITQAFDTYTERSQSGVGLHLWARGKIGQGCKRDGVELYSQERFIVCTGDVWMNRPLRDRQEWLTTMAQQMRPTSTAIELVEKPPLESDYDHWQRKARASNGWKFVELWYGRWQALGIGDGSQSCADLALVRMLCFNNPSNEQVRRMFFASALGQRNKPHTHRTYLNGLIQFARTEEEAERALSTAAARAMAPGIDAEIAAYRAKWGAR